MAGYLCPECLTGDPDGHAVWCTRETAPVCNHGARLTLKCSKCALEAAPPAKLCPHGILTTRICSKCAAVPQAKVCSHGMSLAQVCLLCQAGADARRAMGDHKRTHTVAVLPTTSEGRKRVPIVTGVMDYFPDAIVAVAALSKWGNDKHNPGEPLRWSREKSADHADCIGRHLLERGTLDPESGFSHSVALAWRALALLQIEIEADRAKMSPPVVLSKPIVDYRQPLPGRGCGGADM